MNEYNEDGYPHGLWVSYYPNGQIQAEINYTNGQLNGMAIVYLKNGDTWFIENLKKDGRHGLFIDYKNESVAFYI